MMLVERPGYRIDNRTIKRGSRPGIDRIIRGVLKPLHPCNHLYWFVFVYYRGVVLVLTVLVMTRPSEDVPKRASPILVYGGASSESSPSKAQ